MKEKVVADSSWDKKETELFNSQKKNDLKPQLTYWLTAAASAPGNGINYPHIRL